MLTFVLPRVSRDCTSFSVCGVCLELTDPGCLHSVRTALVLCWGHHRLPSALVGAAIMRGVLPVLVEKPEGKISCCFLNCVSDYSLARLDLEAG